MHDIRAIRENPDAFDAALARRGEEPQSKALLEIDGPRRAAIAEMEEISSAINRMSKEAGKLKASGQDEQFALMVGDVAGLKKKLPGLETRAKEADAALRDALMRIPNLPRDDVPDGKDENDNAEASRWGEPPSFDFEPKQHFDLGEAMGCMDFETAAKLSGARFMVLSGALARLHRALAQFMLDTHVDKNGLTEVWTPVLVRDETMLGTGQLPKFAEDSYRTTNGWWLIPTAEVTLTNIVAGHIVEDGYLPRRYTAHTQCFRSEAGSAGKDTRGMLRQHQFEKVEMVTICRPDDSNDELERMRRCGEGILEALGLAYRTVVLCTGDMGFGARKTYDIEVWMPGQDTYREISSCSTCGDFQSRRMNARYRPVGEDGKPGKPDFVHTLNGSGLAVGRCLIAVMENGQRADGSIAIPEALRPYMGGAEAIGADGTVR